MRKMLAYKTYPMPTIIKLLMGPWNSCSKQVSHSSVANSKHLKRQPTLQSNDKLLELLNPVLHKCKKAMAHGTTPAEVFSLLKHHLQVKVERKTEYHRGQAKTRHN